MFTTYRRPRRYVNLILGIALGLVIATAWAADASASSGHRFPNPGGGTVCKGWLNFQPATDWGAGGIVVKHTTCKKARSVITRSDKYGQWINWSREQRGHDKGLAHGDVRLRQGRAVIVYQTY